MIEVGSLTLVNVEASIDLSPRMLSTSCLITFNAALSIFLFMVDATSEDEFNQCSIGMGPSWWVSM